VREAAIARNFAKGCVTVDPSVQSLARLSARAVTPVSPVRRTFDMDR
jgi:hypothetical protein